MAFAITFIVVLAAQVAGYRYWQYLRGRTVHIDQWNDESLVHKILTERSPVGVMNKFGDN